MPSDWSLDVPIAPDGALARVALAINQRPRRAFGVLKTQDEFVGVVQGHQFEIWERRQRAIHAVGRAHARRGGSRVEVTFRLAPPVRMMLAVFYGLYALVAVGIASQPPDAGLSLLELAIAAAGAAVLAALFYDASRRQRRALAGFLTKVLRAEP